MIAPARRLARADLARPGILVVYLLAPCAAVAVWLLGRAGLAHRWPFPTVIGAIAVAVVASAVAALPWMADRTSFGKLNMKIAAQAAAVATVIYMTGWGPMLVIVFMIVAHENINLAGSSSWKATLAWCSLGLLAGQLAIQVGAAPSLVSVRQSWAVAALAEMGLIATVRQLSLLVADKERTEQALAHAERRFRLLVNNASDVILLVTSAGRVVQASPAVERVLGYMMVELEGHDIFSIIHPDEVDHVREVFTDSLDAPGELVEVECRVRSRLESGPLTAGRRRRPLEAVASESEPWLWMEATVVNLIAEPATNGLVVTLHDVTERRHQATHDELTGLANRSVLADLGNRCSEGARETGQRWGFLLMDLDRFKEVNDTYGHHYGDELLREVAGRLARAVREPDTVVRLGGDEFAVVLPEVSSSMAAVQVTDRIILSLAAPFQVMDVSVSIGVSVGIALFPDNGDSLTELMRKADAAMYEAKRDGTGYSIAA